LKEKYLIPDEDAEQLCSFLEPMLNVNPEQRATAADMVKHPWLRGVRVVGEEAVEAMDEADADAKEGGANDKGKEPAVPLSSREQALANAKAVDPSLVDALKPADSRPPSTSPKLPQGSSSSKDGEKSKSGSQSASEVTTPTTPTTPASASVSAPAQRV
jgi:serine/threonine-protein kinase SRPK3